MNVALVLAGGTGSRMGGDIPKQYIKVKDRTIMSYCLETLFSSEEIDAVEIVAADMWQQDIVWEIAALGIDKKAKFCGFAVPGENRQLSIFNGLTDIGERFKDANVLIHDAARPLLSFDLIARCFAALKGHDGVMPVLAMKDTVYYSEDGIRVGNLLERNKLFAGQAPELYRLDKYMAACENLIPDRILAINGSTEPAILAGLDVAMIPGDENNFKITTMEDLKRFIAIMDTGK